MLPNMNLEDLPSVIQDRFDRLKELDYKELLKMKIAPKDLHFSTKPVRFEGFFESVKFQCFVHDFIIYCKLLINVETRQEVLEKEAKERRLEPPKVLRSDLQEIANKGKNLAMRYSMILLELVSQKHRLLSLDYNTFKKENELYEIFILLNVKVAQCYFQEDYHQFIEEECHRLLRSGAFNESRRKQFDLEKLKKFPILEEQSGKESMDAMITRLMKRTQLPHVNWNFHYHNQKSDTKPNFIKMKPFEAKNLRSPLISLVVPSIKFKLHEFEKKRKEKVSSVPRPSSVLKKRVPALFEKEVSRGHTMDESFDGRAFKRRDLNKSVL